MAKHAYQNHDNLTIGKGRTPYASPSDITNINTAILHLRNAKDARNSTLYLKELGDAIRLLRSLWQSETN